ncbi:Maf family protein [Petrachloros mirabilis]
MRIVLASTSPRRRELLALLGVPFEPRSPVFEEQLAPGRSAEEMVDHFAQEKAHSIAKEDREAVVLGSDTLIDLDGEVLGKPEDLTEARSMLRRMAGRAHQVLTAVTITCLERHLDMTARATALVRMKPFDSAAHERYLATGDSLGKAGAYSIQGPGCELIEQVEGDYLTVVGFPLRLVAMLLMKAGVKLSVDVEELYRARTYGTWSRFSCTSPS